jgi:hypothetical protein
MDKLKAWTREKTCKDCKTALPIDYFAPEKRSADGFTAVCRMCKKKRQKELKELKADSDPKQILKKHKMLKIIRKIASGESLSDAYFDLGTTKNKTVASSAASNFIRTFNDTEKNLFRKMLTPPPILNGIKEFFTDVLTRSVVVTIDEYNKTLANWSKLTGAFLEEDNPSTTITTEQSLTTLEEVAKMLEQQENKQLKEGE